MEIASGVHHFTNYKFNWYIIEDGDSVTVLDTGFPGHYRLFKEGLRSMGRSVADVEAILITHAHADHTGFGPRLAKETGAPIFLHGADTALAARPLYLPWGGLLSRAWRPYTASMLAHAVVNGLLRLPRIKSAQPIHDGEQLDIPGRPTIIHVPGHTPGDVVVHLPDRGVLFSGDALVTRDLYSGRDTAPQVTAPSLSKDFGDAVSHLDRLTELGTVRLLPGHGRPWSGDARDAVEGAVNAVPEKRRETLRSV
jgi:glyoxylase-like metal-dependent hydrolase (beta-lactamase superfamily II)